MLAEIFFKHPGSTPGGSTNFNKKGYINMQQFGNFGGGGAATTAPKVNISADDLKTLECENCKGVIFSEGIIIKTVSALLTQNGKEGMVPIPAFYCIKCQEPVDKYLPEELRKKRIKLT